MTRSMGCLLATLLLAACSSGSGNDGDTSATSDLDPARWAAGVVRLPGRVAGASVEVLLSTGPGQEELLATATTAEDGVFSFRFDQAPDGALLRIRARGGLLNPGSTPAMQDPELLDALVAASALDSGQTVALDPWSTLAACLAPAYYLDGDPELPPAPTWQEAAALASLRIARHLSPTAPPQIPLREPVDPCTETALWPSEQALLGHTVAGLARVAADVSQQTGTTVTTAALVAALCRDISDSVFDGSGPASPGAKPTAIPLGGAELPPEATRFLLAKAIHEQVLDGCSGGRTDILDDFTAADGLYEDISMDMGPLYPPGLPVPFDPVAPEVSFSDPTPDDGFLVCDAATLHAAATDNLALTSLTLWGPGPYAGLAGKLASPPFAASIDLEVSAQSCPADGPADFVVEARDTAGNAAQASLSLVMDASPPELLLVSPSPDACTATPPDAIVVQASDSGSGIADVSVRVENNDLACEPLSDDTWTCSGLELLDGQLLEVTVADTCKRTALKSGKLCVDLTPPAVSFAPEPGAFYGPAANVAVVTVADDKVVASVTVTLQGQSVAVELPGPFEVPLPVEPETTPKIVTLTVEASDAVGNSIVENATYTPDLEAPQMAIVAGQSLVIAPGEPLQIALKIVDSGSGVDSVTCLSSCGDCAVTGQDQGLYEVTGTCPAPLPPGLIDIEVTATDGVGNLQSLGVTLWADASPPEVLLLPFGFKDEGLLVPTLAQPDAAVQYPEDALAGVTFSPETCTPLCPPFSKLASRLGFQDDGDLQANNLPALRFVVSDVCPPAAAFDSAVWVSYAFFSSGKPLGSGSLPSAACTGSEYTLPIATQVFAGVPPEQATFASGDLPDTLIITATDATGWSATLEAKLSMTVLPPPLFLFYEDQQLPADPVSALTVPAAPKLDLLLAQGATLRRLALVNPTPVPATATLSDPPHEWVSIAVKRVYLPASGPSMAGCAWGLCRYVESGTEVQACTAPLAFDETPLIDLPAHPAPVRVLSPDGSQATLGSGDTFPVPGETTLLLDVLASYQAATQVLPAVSMKPDGVTQKWANPTDEPTWNVSCNLTTKVPPLFTYFTAPQIVVFYASKPAAGDTVVLQTAAASASASRPVAKSVAWSALYMPDFSTNTVP